jgi:glucose/arabinose dehydrogenase
MTPRRTLALTLGLCTVGLAAASDNPTRTGKDAMGDWTTDAPGVRRKLSVADLPRPYDTPSVDNGPQWAPRPAGALPKAPAGFTVSEFAGKLVGPRVVKAAPNGDLFVVESESGRITVLRDADRDGKAEVRAEYTSGLSKPFGIAFWPAGPEPQWLYIANTDAVVRIPYRNGDLKAATRPDTVVANLPGGGRLRGGGHWTRDIEFSADGETFFVSVGSISNVDDPDVNKNEARRAAILAFDRDGTNERIFASGIRNAVGLAVQPGKGTLWCSVNERDGLGDMLVPDYVTRVKEGGFYGWPYYYLGGNPDPRHVGKHPELKAKSLVPDVLLQAHSASLDLAFYTGKAFPKAYRGELFACEHGSWNRARRTGYKVVRIPLRRGKPTGEYEDFLTGFVVDNQSVWGRPVGVTTGIDGALYVTDDFSGTVWRVAWTGKP